MTSLKFPRYGLLALSAGVAIAAAGWAGYGPDGVLTATPNAATGYSTDTTTPSIPSTTLTPPPSPTAAPTLPPAPPSP